MASKCDIAGGSGVLDNNNQTRPKVKRTFFEKVSEIGSDALPFKNNNKDTNPMNIYNNVFVYEDGKFRSANDLINANFKAIENASDLKPDKKTLASIVKSIKNNIVQGKFFRSFKDLDQNKYADLHYYILANVKNSAVVSREQIERQLGEMYSDLDSTELDFLRKVILVNSQIDNINAGLPIPYQDSVLEMLGVEDGDNVIMEQVVMQAKQEIDKELQSNERMREIIERRDTMFANLQGKLIERYVEVYGEHHREAISELFKHENYYRNIVLEYEQFLDGEKKNNYKTNTSKNSVAEYFKRMGTTKDIRSNFLYVDTLALGHLQEQIYRLDFIEALRKNPKYNKTHDVLRSFKEDIKQKVDLVKGAYRNSELDALDERQKENIDKTLIRMINRLQNDLSIHPSLKQILNQTLGTLDVDGKQRDIFDRIDYTINKTLEMQEVRFKNEVNPQLLKNFYNTYPEFKDVIEYLVGQREHISRVKMLNFYKAYSTMDSQYLGSSIAKHISDLHNTKNEMSKSMRMNLGININNYIDSEKMSFLDRYGNPINPKTGRNELTQIKVGSLIDFSYQTPDQLGEMLFDHFMAQFNEDYIDQMIEDGNVMIVDKDLAQGIESALTYDKQTSGIIKWFNVNARKWMLLSPERVLKFNTLTAMSADMYRMVQTNPKAFKNLGRSLKLVVEYHKNGKLENEQDQKLFEEFKKLFGGQFTINAREIEMKINSKAFKELEGKLHGKEKLNPLEVKKMLKKYIDVVGSITTGREMVGRLAYALDVMDRINNGKDINYGASNKKQALALYDTSTKEGNPYAFASLVSNQNFISYQEAGYIAKNLNRTWMPFFLFKEGNIKWHYRLYKNYINDIINKQTSLETKAKAMGKMSVSASLTFGIAQAIWNTIARAIDPSLPEDDGIPDHLKGIESVLGVPMGESYLLIPGLRGVNNKFTLSQDALRMIPFLDGSIGDYAKTLISSTNPVIKSPVEMLYGADFYANGDLVPVSDKYDMPANAMRKVAQLFGMNTLYEHGHDTIKGIPNRDGNVFEDLWGNQFNQLKPNGILDYYTSQSYIYDYMESIGKEFKPEIGYASEEERYRFSIKEGFKAGNLGYVDKSIYAYMEYLASEGHDEGKIKQKIKGVIRSMDLMTMGNLSNKEREEMFVNMSEGQVETFLKGLQHQQEMLDYYGQLLN